MKFIHFLRQFLIIALISYSCKSDISGKEFIVAREAHNGLSGSSIPEFPSREIQELKSFIKNNKAVNNKIVFLVDMKMPSNRNRFYVVDLSNDSIIDKGLVAQGNNTVPDKKGKLIFSNEINSGCTSLGKYMVGTSYYGRFGKAYKLYGLDKTNSNAFARFVVLHKYDEVPEEEQEEDICYSRGCPMISPGFFKKIENIIDHSDKNILLEIYY